MSTESSAATSLVWRETPRERDLIEIHTSLSRQQKMLSPKFFYDERGSRLFEAICKLPEYYPTRTEISIMRDHLPQMAKMIGPRPNIIEFGIGSGLKTKLLLAALDRPVAFTPVDISRQHLEEIATQLRVDFPDIEMLPVATDFTQPFPLPKPSRAADRNLVYFPGSTIGNFEPASAIDLLRVMRAEAGRGGALLIGIDLRKDVNILEDAYNDSAGITAQFNLNMLHRLNRQFGADFDVDTFHHRAIYKEERGRIEMHLVSLLDQEFSIGGKCYSMDVNETICTEYSYKYTLEQFAGMAKQAGFAVKRVWTDPRRWFSMQYCQSA